MTGINTPNALLVLAAAVYLHGCMTSPARSEPADRVTVDHNPPPGAAWFARVQIDNRIGTYNRVTTHDTAHGPVSVQYWTTPPHALHDPASADRACVLSLPPGVVAMPECVEILEQQRGEILLLRYLGG